MCVWLWVAVGGCVWLCVAVCGCVCVSSCMCSPSRHHRCPHTRSFGNAGQNCIGIERMYVYEGVYDKFVQRITANMKSFRQGLPLGDDYVDAGAMTMPAQIQIVDDLVQDAVAKGATLLCGGKRNPNLPGTFYEPTVLLGVTHDMRIANEEVFGPVMSVFKVTGGDQQCIAMVNSTEYGLGSSIFTRDLARGERLQRAVRAGMTCINDFGVRGGFAHSSAAGGRGCRGGGADGWRALGWLGVCMCVRDRPTTWPSRCRSAAWASLASAALAVRKACRRAAT